MVSKFLDQLSVSFLKRVREKDSIKQEADAKPETEFLREAQLAFGKQLLGALMRLPNHAGTLHQLIRETEIPLRVALKVIEFLAENGYVKIVKREDLMGDHGLRGTEKSQELLES